MPSSCDWPSAGTPEVAAATEQEHNENDDQDQRQHSLNSLTS
jgi:hypothetical protein